MSNDMLETLVARSRTDSLRDRCLVVSLAMHELFGGALDIYKSSTGDHFVNLIGGEELDLTHDHSDVAHGRIGEIVPSPELLCGVPRIAMQLRDVKSRLCAELGRRLPIREIQHVVIQEQDENLGSAIRPEFTCALLLGSGERRLDTGLLAPGQTVWLKFTNNRIVARGKVMTWVSALRREWTDDDIRSVCRDTALAEDHATWRRLADSPANHFVVLFIDAAEALDVPIFPNDRGYGRAIVPLTTLAHQIAWLHSDIDQKLPLYAPPAAPYTPFYRFRWEHELDADVSRAIDDRMPKGGRFLDRVRIVNEALREYFALIERQPDVSAEFTGDELTFLAEIIEDGEIDGRVSQRQLVQRTRWLGEGLVIEGNDDGATLLHLAELVDSLSAGEYSVLMDAVYRIVPRLYRLNDRRFHVIRTWHDGREALTGDR